MKTFILLLLIPFTLQLEAKLLDKTLAVINDHVVTKSQITRIKSSLKARANIIPQIYSNKNLNTKQITEKLINQYIIRKKINELGLNVTDQQVETSIEQREKNLGISRSRLIKFLDQNNLSFDEYFELTREAIEHQNFISWIIRPLVSVTEQEIKNFYLRKNKSKSTGSFNYTLVDFSINKSKVKNKKKFKADLKKFQKNGVLPNYLKNLETNVLNDVSSDGLNNKILREVKKVNINEFTNPIILGNQFHIFFIKEKQIITSEDYLRQKNNIKAHLLGKAIEKVANSWFESEKSKFYIKYFY